MPVMEEVDKTVEKIKKLEIQGAENIAKESLRVLGEVVKKDSRKFEEAADKLMIARPTGVSTFNLISWVKKRRDLNSINRALNWIDRSNEWTSLHGAKLIQENYNVMTHCHSSTVMRIFKKANKEKKNFKVFVSETRPKKQGIITARELARMDVPVVYFIDSASGLFSFSCDLVLVGADAIKPDGVVNKIGTYLIALAAKEANIPFYVAASKDKLDYENFSEIEERPREEVINPEKLEAKIENPGFDLTPWKFVEGVVMERGILKEEEVLDLFGEEFEIE